MAKDISKFLPKQAKPVRRAYHGVQPVSTAEGINPSGARCGCARGKVVFCFTQSCLEQQQQQQQRAGCQCVITGSLCN